MIDRNVVGMGWSSMLHGPVQTNQLTTLPHVLLAACGPWDAQRARDKLKQNKKTFLTRMRDKELLRCYTKSVSIGSLLDRHKLMEYPGTRNAYLVLE